uniref:ATP synthase F0 subunit 8 n=1 Tax=Ophioleila elegans TaxID=1815333 RepID=UPI0023F2CD9E|nr:ATP synthase F0 subunit 8 [Ophioleila elegans]WED07066.1 ATP synthase F0 subunit 8 [Ophioleila elegans]
MPQLEFSLWLPNLFINWFLIITLIAAINNSSTTPNNFNANQNLIENYNTQNWPW